METWDFEGTINKMIEEQSDIYPYWKEKCLKWLKERKSEKNDWLFEKGKWYIKLCHDYDGDLRHFQKGHVYQAVSETCITDGYHHASLGSWEIPRYFRPANIEEIPQESDYNEDEKTMKALIKLVKQTGIGYENVTDDYDNLLYKSIQQACC